MNLKNYVLSFALLWCSSAWAVNFNPFVSGPYDPGFTTYNVDVTNVTATPSPNKDGDIELIFDADGNPETVEISAAITGNTNA